MHYLLSLVKKFLKEMEPTGFKFNYANLRPAVTSDTAAGYFRNGIES